MKKFLSQTKSAGSLFGGLTLALAMLVLAGVSPVLAATGTFSSSLITANVSEVKASRTLSVNSIPADGETITIGSCVVTFESGAGTGNNSAATDDTNCTGGATIHTYTATNPGVLRTTTQLANALDALTNVSDAVHGSVTVASDSATTTRFTTTATENSASNLTFADGTGGNITASSTVAGVVPVAQVVTFTPGNPTNGETFRATINGNTYSVNVSGSPSVQTVVESLQTIMNAEGNTTCTEDNTKITCTADVAGNAFTYATTVLNGQQVDTVTVTIVKYVDGTKATSGGPFPIQVTSTASNQNSGNQMVTSSSLASSSYSFTSAAMNQGADYKVTELVNGSQVGNSCSDGKPYALRGYTVGNSVADAADNSVSSTIPDLKNLQTNKYIIVWNERCDDDSDDNDDSDNGGGICQSAKIDRIQAKIDALDDSNTNSRSYQIALHTLVDSLEKAEEECDSDYDYGYHHDRYGIPYSQHDDDNADIWESYNNGGEYEDWEDDSDDDSWKSGHRGGKRESGWRDNDGWENQNHNSWENDDSDDDDSWKRGNRGEWQQSDNSDNGNHWNGGRNRR